MHNNSHMIDMAITTSTKYKHVHWLKAFAAIHVALSKALICEPLVMHDNNKKADQAYGMQHDHQSNTLSVI